MKVKLISSPQNGCELIYGSGRKPPVLEFIDFVFEIECEDLRPFQPMMAEYAAVYREETYYPFANANINLPSGLVHAEQQRLFYDAIADASTSFDMLKEIADAEAAASVLPAGALAKATVKFTLKGLSTLAAMSLSPSMPASHLGLFSMVRRVVLREHAWAHQFLQ